MVNVRYVIARIIYICSVTEKGRCCGMIWGVGYKALLKRVIDFLYSFVELLYSNNFYNTEHILKDFEIFCRSNKTYREVFISSDENFFDISAIDFSIGKFGEKYDNINKIMYILISALKNETDNFHTDKEKIYYLFDSLHNLPRVYFGTDKRRISADTAIEYLKLSLTGYTGKILSDKLQMNLSAEE